VALCQVVGWDKGGNDDSALGEQFIYSERGWIFIYISNWDHMICLWSI